MIVEREIKLMRGWDRLSKKQKGIIEFFMVHKKMEGALSAMNKTVFGDKDPSNFAQAVQGLCRYGIMQKEYRSSHNVVLTLMEDYDEKIMRLGEVED